METIPNHRYADCTIQMRDSYRTKQVTIALYPKDNTPMVLDRMIFFYCKSKRIFLDMVASNCEREEFIVLDYFFY